MRHILTIWRWEINKIIGNWQKAAAIFLVPAAIMVLAINLFPQILSYLTTGSIGSQKVIIVNAPDSFIDYGDKHLESYNYEYIHWELDEIDEPQIQEQISSGSLLVLFERDNEYDYLNFDGAVETYYDQISRGNVHYESEAYARIFYNPSSVVLATKAESFKVNVMEPYKSSLLYTLGGSYSEMADSNITIDGYNPITTVLNHRSNANFMAARVVPGILALLMYYCVYSLTCDMLAQEKTRGFLAKLVMSPVEPLYIIAGKIAAIVSLVTVSGLITFLFLFISSWLNRSNDSMSLLPFGMLLKPVELLYLVLIIPAVGFAMAAFCFMVTLQLNRLGDIIANLQVPLMFFLIDFFIQLVSSSEATFIEVIIPIHNIIAITKMAYVSSIDFLRFLLAMFVNVGFGLLVCRECAKKLAEDIST